MSWTERERQRFESGVIEALGDAGVSCEPIPGSLRVMLGGSTATGAAAVVTWASRHGKLTQHRSTITTAELGAILHHAAEKLNGSEGAGR